MSEILLDIKGLCTSYGRIPMLMDVDLNIHKGNVCCVLGANGAGKSTLVKAIINMVRADRGTMTLEGENIDSWPTHKRIAGGIQVSSAGTGTFHKMTVETNLRLGAYNINDKTVLHERLEEIYLSFPVLKERLKQNAGTLSGGERTMLSIARAVINRPKLQIMDEPSLGLAPIVIEEVFDIVRRLNRQEHMTIMLVEQNAAKALSVSKFGYVIQKGQIVFSGDIDALKNSEYLENPVM